MKVKEFKACISLVFVEKKEVIKSRLGIEELAMFCKRKGFVFASSEIYGGFSGFWDFGPFGVELFNNIKQSWWRYFVHQQENIVGIDASIISHPKTWKASGHLESFNDVSVQCGKCKKFNKIDKSELAKANCGFCDGKFNKESAKDLNLMFKTEIGPVTETSTVSYLRPETAQGMFLDFKTIADTGRVKLPFGIAQIGKCFRNEIAPRDFLFRSREFTIGEFEFFIHPEEKKCRLLKKRHLLLKLKLLDAEMQEKDKDVTREITIEKMLKLGKLEEWHAYWLAEQMLWFEQIGIADKIKVREHKKSELSHYSSATFDIDYEYMFGSKEVAGIANRGQFDLTQHMKHSGQKLEIFDEATKSRVIPSVIEPTFGMERVFLAVLSQAYIYDKKRENVLLNLPVFLSPVKMAVLPIVKDAKMMKMAKEIVNELRKDMNVAYDDSGSIGRRYSRNDEIGTPACVAVDEQSTKDKSVTIRDRNTTKQIRVKAENVAEILSKLIKGENLLKLGKVVETRVK